MRRASLALSLALSLGGCNGAKASPSSRPAPPEAPPAGAEAAGSSGARGPLVPHASSWAGKVVIEERAMGTRVTVTAFPSARAPEARVRAAARRAMDEIHRLEGLMTTWRESELTRVNALAGRGPSPVSPETFEVIEKSLWASRVSDGAFDISFEAMHGLWRFDQDLDPHPPPPEAVAERRRLIDYRRIAVDPAARTVHLLEAGMKISLGGIGKGYAVDRASRILLDEGVVDFSVQAGGDLFTHGRKPDGAPWVVGVRDPRGPEGSYFATLPVEDHAFSTAGDYERAYVAGGKRYHHIIDPRTGYPAEGARAVTIWARDALTADAVDDAVLILGPERGLALVESIDGCGAVIVGPDNRVWVSERLKGKLRVHRQPTDGL